MFILLAPNKLLLLLQYHHRYYLMELTTSGICDGNHTLSVARNSLSCQGVSFPISTEGSEKILFIIVFFFSLLIEH